MMGNVSLLGIVIQPLTAELAESFDMEQTQGILIAQVSADSPAHAGQVAEPANARSFTDSDRTTAKKIR